MSSIAGVTTYQSAVEEESFSIAYPANIGSGDKLILVVGSEDSFTNETIVDPTGTGFTVAAEYGMNNAASCQLTILERNAAGTESGTLTVNTVAGTDYFVAAMFRITGASSNAITVGTGTGAAEASASSRIASAIASAPADAMVFACVATDGADLGPFSISGTGWPSSPGTTLASAGGGAGAGLAIATKTLGSTGSTSNATFTPSSSDGMVALQFYIEDGTSSGPQTWSGSTASLTLDGQSPGWSGGEQSSIEGIWISAAEIAGFPMSGDAWNNVKTAADAYDGATMTEYDNQDSTDMGNMLAAAIVFARTGTESYRTEVETALNIIANNSYDKANLSALGWARMFTPMVAAADLIDLENHNPTLNSQFISFIDGAVYEPYSGDGGSSLGDLAESRPNNIGVLARTAVTAIYIYTGNTAKLQEFADRYREWVEGEDVYSFSWNSNQSWQEDPNDPSTWKGIVRQGVFRDGNNFDGVIPEDYRRNEGGIVYDGTNYPGTDTTDYPIDVIGAAAVNAELLRRNGYPQAPSWGDIHVERAWVRFYDLTVNYGWDYPIGNDRWVPHLINALYNRNDPVDTTTQVGRPMSWTDFTHQEAPNGVGGNQSWTGSHGSLSITGTSGSFVGSSVPQTWNGTAGAMVLNGTSGNFVRVSATIIGLSPDAATQAAFVDSVVRVERWADIYEYDNSTLWRANVPIVSGSVSVDMTRNERRNLEIEFIDMDNNLGYGTDGDSFWYDKIIRPYRGIRFATGDIFAAPLGHFIPDAISRPRFPNTLKASCRDLTKKLILNKFSQTTTFPQGSNVGSVISTIATNGGIIDQTFSATSKTLVEDVTFERNTPRWEAIKELAASIGHEVFFNAAGSLVFRPFVDPTTAPVAYNFNDTPTTGTLVDWNRSTTDTRLFNDILVIGTGQDNKLVWAQATNTEPTSPTRVGEIGYRTDTFESQFVPDNTTAQEIADALLSVAALEQFDMSFSAIMLPWLEVGDAVEIVTDDAAPGDPTRFLLAQLSIDLGLGPMSGTGRRVTNVG